MNCWQHCVWLDRPEILNFLPPDPETHALRRSTNYSIVYDKAEGTWLENSPLPRSDYNPEISSKRVHKMLYHIFDKTLSLTR